MAIAGTSRILINHSEQKLAGRGRLWLNAEHHTSVVAGSSPGVDVTAVVVIDGLQPGEYVEVRWVREWKKKGEPDQFEGAQAHDTAVFYSPRSLPTATVHYRQNLGKADAGWTNCLRLAYETDSKTAVVNNLQIRGWEIEN